MVKFRDNLIFAYSAIPYSTKVSTKFIIIISHNLLFLISHNDIDMDW